VDEPLQTTLVDIIDLLQGEGIAYALIGGQATSLRGEPRVTADIDLVLAIEVDQALDLVSKLPESNFKPLFDGIEEVVERSFILPLRHRTTSIKVDLAIGLSGFERQAVSRAQPLEVAGRTIPIATTEDLIILKALAARPRDEQDIRGLIIAQRGAIDWDYCETTAAALGEALGSDLLTRIRQLRTM
jgi:hypothetical protein